MLGPTLHNGERHEAGAGDRPRLPGRRRRAADHRHHRLRPLRPGRAGGRRASSASAFACFALADSVFAYTTLHDQTRLGGLEHGLGRRLPAHRPRAPTTPPAIHPPGRRARRPHATAAPGRCCCRTCPLAVVLALCVGEALVTDPIVVDDVVFWIGAALIALLLVRQGVVIIENPRLARSLAMSNERLAVPGAPRRAHRAAQPAAVHRPAAGGAGPHEPGRRAGGGDVRRPRPVQAGQRHLRPRGRRRRAGHRWADASSAAVRAGDTVARFGGDEFLVLCEDVGDARRGRATWPTAWPRPIGRADPRATATTSCVVTASIGLVLTDSADIDADELVRRADARHVRGQAQGPAAGSSWSTPGRRVGDRRRLSRPRRQAATAPRGSTEPSRSAVRGRRPRDSPIGRRGRRARPGPRRCRRPSGRPAQRMPPGVADRRAIRPCIGMPSTSTIGLPGREVGIDGEVGHGQHRGGRGMGLPRTRPSTSSSGRAATQAATSLVDLGPVVDPAVERVEALVVAHADQVEHPSGHRLGRRADGHPPVVGACGRCCGGRCRGCPSRAGAARSRAGRRPTAAGPSAGTATRAG